MGMKFGQHQPHNRQVERYTREGDAKGRNSRNDKRELSTRAASRSVSSQLDVGGPNQLSPFVGFFGDELAEIGG